MRSLSRKIAQNRSGFYLALAAVLFVCGWRLWTVSQRPAHWEQIALELGSIPQFRHDLIVNNSGTCVVYAQDAEESRGYYLADSATHKARLLNESFLTEPYGWSPDDTRLAYGTPVAANSGQWEIVICDGKSGEPISRLRHPGFYGAAMFTWLSFRSFGYLDRAGGFGSIEQKPDGSWVKGRAWPDIAKTATSLIAVSETSVAWLEGMAGVNEVAYDGTNQHWTVTPVRRNQYKIIAANGLALTAENPNSLVAVRDYTGASNQLWTVTANGTYYNIGNVGSGQNLDDWDGAADTVVGQWEANSANPNQLWKLTRVGETAPPKTTAGTNAIADGAYIITCPAGGDFALNYCSSVIRQLDIRSGAVTTFWESATHSVLEFSYSRKTGELLLNCSDQNGQYFIRTHPIAKWKAEVVRINESEPYFLRRHSLDGGKNKYVSMNGDSIQSVYLSNDGLNLFTINTNLAKGSAVIQAPWRGGVTEYAPLNGSHLFVLGDPSNQPPGVWVYDYTSGSFNCVVSQWNDSRQHGTYVSPVCGEMTNTVGEPRGYTLWQPANFSPRKKYPVIITQTVNEWLPYPHAAANCGYYFAMVRRPFWGSKNIDHWAEDVMGLYQVLAQNPNVDIDRVFLWGRSAETSYLCQLFQGRPELWKGVILFDPGGLPYLSAQELSKLFVITGANAAGHLIDYQARAMEVGVPMKLILQENTGHVSNTIRSERERTRQFAKYLVENL